MFSETFQISHLFVANFIVIILAFFFLPLKKIMSDFKKKQPKMIFSTSPFQIYLILAVSWLIIFLIAFLYYITDEGFIISEYERLFAPLLLLLIYWWTNKKGIFL